MNWYMTAAQTVSGRCFVGVPVLAADAAGAKKASAEAIETAGFGAVSDVYYVDARDKRPVVDVWGEHLRPLLEATGYCAAEEAV